MATEAAAPPKAGKKGLIVLILIAVVAIGAGAALPWLLNKSSHNPQADKKGKHEVPKSKQTALPFDNVVVNLPDERLARFLRVKIMLAIEEVEAKEITELLEKQKAFLKSWVIGYLSDQSPREVTRNIGVNRIRREIRDQFNAMLFPDGEEKILDILFDEFVVQ